MALLFVLAALTGCKTLPAHDPSELSRAWDDGNVEIPSSDRTIVWQWFTKARSLGDREVDGVWPTVIYMHGCSGGSASGQLAQALLRHGFAVVSPNSTAREGYSGSCRIVDGRIFWYVGGREARSIRYADLGYAIEQIKAQPWVDARNVFLIGQSEGGAVVAGFRSADPVHSVRARVIGGTDCYPTGIHAGPDEPVLAILGSGDEALRQARYGKWEGSCGSRFPYPDNGSVNIVMDTTRHGIITGDPIAFKAIIEFLETHRIRD